MPIYAKNCNLLCLCFQTWAGAQLCKYLFCKFSVSIGQPLHLSDEVSHLGHILTFNLCDILRVTKDFNCKSNYLLSIFNCIDHLVKSFLLKSFCLSRYGCSLWSLSSTDIHNIQAAIYQSSTLYATEYACLFRERLLVQKVRC